MMDSEFKMETLVIIVLWLPVIWLAWHLTFKYFKARKRAYIQNMSLGILLEINNLNIDPEIDKNSPEAKKIIQKERELWDQYDELLKQEEKLEKHL